MACFTRSLLRWGLIAGLAVGGATLLVGPDRVAAGFAQIRSHAGAVVDHFVDDPIALHRQLEKLAEQYPERIAEVRGEMAEVDRQITQLTQDTEVAQRVVANTSEDLTDLKTLLAEAESKAATGVKVSIRTNGMRFSVDEARSEARRIAEIRIGYQDRAASNTTQLKFLTEQKGRLAQILDRLNGEFGDFETKLAQLDRQIDAIARNERLIEMTKEQQALLASYDRYGKVGNLNQLEAKLAQLREVQEAQLETLASKGVHSDYEHAARRELADEATRQIESSVDDDAPDNQVPGKSVAWMEPVVIEKK